jgi:predicted RNase H-like HicB family nuclease
MARYLYPAVFDPNENGGYTVTFPDLPGCVTEGDTLDEALQMAA